MSITVAFQKNNIYEQYLIMQELFSQNIQTFTLSLTYEQASVGFSSIEPELWMNRQGKECDYFQPRVRPGEPSSEPRQNWGGEK